MGLQLAFVIVSWLVSYLGIRVGEASNPGSSALISANITSLHSQFDEVVRLNAEMLALQETRLSELAQLDMSRLLGDHGWAAIWGKPMQPQKRKQASVPSAHNARHGAVAVLVRQGIAARAGPVDTPVRKRLWVSGRWVHAVVTFGEAKNALHVFSVYGF